MSQTLVEDRDTKAWANKYVADLNFQVYGFTPNVPWQTIFTYDPFISNPANNPLKITNISFTDSANQAGELDIRIDDSKDRIIDRDIIDNGMNIILLGARKGFQSTTTVPMFFGYIEEIVETRRRGPAHHYDLHGLSTLGKFQNILVNFVESARRDSLTSTEFSLDRRFEAHKLVRQLFEDYQVLPVQGGGKQNVSERAQVSLNNISPDVNQIIPVVDFPVVYASQVLATIADMTGADIYVDASNDLHFGYPNIDRDITYVKDKFDLTIPDQDQDPAWNTSYVLSEYVRHGSTRPSDGFANYLVGVATTEGSIEIAETEQQNFTTLANKDISQQFTAVSNGFFYIAFVASKVGGGSHVNNPSEDKLRVRIIADNNGLPTGGVITQFFVKLRDIDEEPTVIAPPPNNQLVRVTPGAKYWITWYRKGVNDNDTIRIWHDNRLNPTPTHRSAQRIVQIDTDTGAENPRATDQKAGGATRGWFWSASGPTYAHAVASPERKIILDMADELSIQRWGQVDSRVEATSWIHTPKQLGEYMSALMNYTSKKRWIYNFPEVTIPLRPIRAGRAISLRDEVLGISGIDEVDAYSIIQEVTYEIKAEEYALGTNSCSITSLGFQNPLDYTIGF